MLIQQTLPPHPDVVEHHEAVVEAVEPELLAHVPDGDARERQEGLRVADLHDEAVEAAIAGLAARGDELGVDDGVGRRLAEVARPEKER